MRQAAGLVLGLALIGAPAAAQPAIPPSEMPGRERERFVEPFKKPEDLRNDPGVRRDKKTDSAPRSVPKKRDQRRD